MALLFGVILLIHIVTAVIGFGQTFFYPWMLLKVKKGYEVKYTAGLIASMAHVAKISDYLLLVTGLLMVFVKNMGFHHDWLILAICLFVIMRLFSGVFSRKTTSELWSIMENMEGEQISSVFFEKRQR